MSNNQLTPTQRRDLERKANLSFLVFGLGVVGLLLLENGLLPDDFPFLLVFGVTCPVAVSVMGLLVARALVSKVGLRRVLAWRPLVLKLSLALWLSGCFRGLQAFMKSMDSAIGTNLSLLLCVLVILGVPLIVLHLSWSGPSDDDKQAGD